MRDTTEAARMLMEADDKFLRKIMRHDPDMIRDVAAALVRARSPKPQRFHNEDCELRGMDFCYCDQSLGRDYP